MGDGAISQDKRGRLTAASATAARVAGPAASGAAVALAFPPFDAEWLMPLGLAGLMLAVRGSRGRSGALAGLCFGLGLMLPLVRWITVIGSDAWVSGGRRVRRAPRRDAGTRPWDRGAASRPAV